jgi:endonuclease III
MESGVVEDEELGELNLARKLEQDQGRIRVLTGSPSERHTVLDSLIGTILSQNTTDNNSRRAFASLKTAFPTWEEVCHVSPSLFCQFIFYLVMTSLVSLSEARSQL